MFALKLLAMPNTDCVKAVIVATLGTRVNRTSERWFLRGFVQKLSNSAAITGLGMTDLSPGLTTSTFTLKPRRYGVTAGVRF